MISKEEIRAEERIAHIGNPKIKSKAEIANFYRTVTWVFKNEKGAAHYAEKIGYSASTFRNVFNPSNPSLPPFHLVLNALIELNSDTVNEELCQILGGHFIRDTELLDVEDAILELIKLVGVSGELSSQICEALADGELSPNGKKYVYAAIEKIRKHLGRSMAAM